jgi:hypothetical protein
MNKEQEKQLLKFAADTPGDSLLASPMLQAAILGGLGYLGTDFLYDKISNNAWQEQYINSIEDPVQREMLRAQLRVERERKKKWWARGAGILGASIPLLSNMGTIKEGWKQGAKSYGGPTEIDKFVGGLTGAAATGIGGREALDNMSKAYGNPADKRRNFMETGTTAGLGYNPLKKLSSENSYMYENLMEKCASLDNNAFAGMDFQMPYIRPLSTNGFKDIPVASSIKLVQSPNNAMIMGPNLSQGLADSLNHASGGIGAGLISTNDLMKSMFRVGIGYEIGKRLAPIAGTIFAQPPQVKEQLASIGGIGGAFLNSGILR